MTMLEFLAWMEGGLLVVALGSILAARWIFRLILDDVTSERDRLQAEVDRLHNLEEVKAG